MTFKVKRKKDVGDEVLEEWFYSTIPNVVQKTNPAKITAKGMGVTDEKQKEINKGKIKVSSNHLKAMGVRKDIKNY